MLLLNQCILLNLDHNTKEEDTTETVVINNLPLGTKAVDVRALVSAHGKVSFYW